MAPGALHQLVATYLAHMCISQIDEYPINCLVTTELDWNVDEINILRPDILVICGHKPDSEYIRTTPNLVIYQRKQVPYYILVYPEEEAVRIFEFR